MSVILRKFYVSNHLNFAFLSNIGFVSLAMLLLINMSLNSVNRYQRYNNIKINKNTMAGLYVNSSMKLCESLNFQIMLYFLQHLLFASR